MIKECNSMHKVAGFFRLLLCSLSLPGIVIADASSEYAPMQLPSYVSRDRATPIVRAVAKVMPSVVNISTEHIQRVSDPFAAFFHEFFDRHYQVYKETIPLGSGIVIDESGLILTNDHVIRRASRVHVRLYDGQDYKAIPVAHDPTNDLALLAIQDLPDNVKLQAVLFALPEDLLLGETVITVGNPFGLQHSVAAGVLSAKNRSLKEGNVLFNDILQTDAAINPGNSGGPMLNLDGHLIGINLAIRRDAEGIGFAIPLRRVEKVLAGWLIPERFSLGACGFTARSETNHQGIYAVIDRVDHDSPAAAAGLQSGDIIQAINGQAVTRALDVGRIMYRKRNGDNIDLTLADNRRVSFTIQQIHPNQLARHRLGIQVQPLTTPLRQAMGLGEAVQGLVLSEVADNSPLKTAGLNRGDIIFRLGDQAVTTAEELFAALRQLHPGDIVTMFFASIEDIRGRRFLRRFAINVTLQ